MFRNPYKATFNVVWSSDTTSNLTRADIVVFFQILGVLYMLAHSVYLRKLLVGLSLELDKNEISPSDFAIVVRNIPKSMGKEDLKEEIEKLVPDSKVQYVNLCYNIDKIVELDKKIKELSKHRGFYKLYLKKQIKAKGIKKEDLKANPQLIPPPEVKDGFFKKKTLNLKSIEDELNATFKSLEDFGKDLTPGKTGDLFVGVGIVVLSTQKSQQEVMKKSGVSFLKSFFARIFPCFFGGSGNQGASAFTFERAPEPSDVYWENLSITSFQRFLRVCATYFATFIIIGICFAIIWGINVGKTNLEKTSDKNSGSVRFLSFVCSFVIIITNTSLRTVVRALSLKE